jgi:hypothetical protein
MEKVRKATADTAKESDKLDKVGHAAERVGGSLLTMGVAAADSVLIVTKMAADFGAQMSKVQAATNATASEMDKFRNQSLTAGAAFGYTATQATEAQVELGKAGLATRDISSQGWRSRGCPVSPSYRWGQRGVPRAGIMSGPKLVYRIGHNDTPSAPQTGGTAGWQLPSGRVYR